MREEDGFNKDLMVSFRLKINFLYYNKEFSWNKQGYVNCTPESLEVIR